MPVLQRSVNEMLRGIEDNISDYVESLLTDASVAMEPLKEPEFHDHVKFTTVMHELGDIYSAIQDNESELSCTEGS